MSLDWGLVRARPWAQCSSGQKELLILSSSKPSGSLIGKQKEKKRLFEHDLNLACPAGEGQPHLEVGKRRDKEESMQLLRKDSWCVWFSEEHRLWHQMELGVNSSSAVY